MDKELIESLKKRLSKHSTILDIGFGAGRISFSIITEIAPIKILGIESRKKEDVEKDYDGFLGPEFDNGISEIRKSDGTIDLFDYYKYLATKSEKQPLDVHHFYKIVHVLFNKEFQRFIEENESYFDLVILFNVLHYSEIGEPKSVLDQVKNILTENGLLLVSFKNYKHCAEYTDRQEVNISDAVNYLDSHFKKLFYQESELENSIIYLGQRCSSAQIDNYQTSSDDI